MTVGSLAALVLICGLWARRTGEWRPFVLQCGAALIFAIFLNILFGFPIPQTSVIAKGPQEDLLLAVALYACMLLGVGPLGGLWL